MGIYDWLGFAGVAAGMFAAILWFLASRIKVPHDSHAMVPALRRDGPNERQSGPLRVHSGDMYLFGMAGHARKTLRPAQAGASGG